MIKKTLKKENNEVVKLLTSDICTDDGTLLTDLIKLFNNFKFIPQENNTINIDDITESGIIQVIDTPNGTLPIDISRDSNNFFLITLVRIEDNPYRRQILLDIRTTNIYTRHRGVSGWLPWTSLNNNYYNNEQITGVWIDGRPIYRKVIQVSGSVFTSNYTYIIHQIQNLDIFIKLSVTYKDGDKTRIMPASYFGTTTWSGQCIADKTYLMFELGDEMLTNIQKTSTCYIILEYIKTTN